MPALPARPLLAAHVLARRHVVGGEARIVLHDRTTGRLVQIGPREWELLAAADGTRDLEGILLAAAREGAHARAPALEAFLQQLQRDGMLEDGAGVPPPAEREPAADDVGGRPLDPLAGYGLTCDGSGGCCRFYASVLFGPVEAARARALLPHVLDGGERHDRVFMPEHGSRATTASAVTLRDGRCAYLTDAGCCGIHEAGGAAAKPVGCNAYPAIYVDDGESLRVSVAVECACVLSSVDREGGVPLIPPGARVRRDLDAALAVVTLPSIVHITPDATAPREELVAWSRRVAALPPPADAVASLFSLGAAVEAGGLATDVVRPFTAPAPLAPSALMPWIAALHRRAVRRVREDAAWRSERDLALQTARWVATTTEALLDEDALGALLEAPVAAPHLEAFYLRALLHGHALVGGPPLSRALQDRAVRLIVARALPVILAAAPTDELSPPCAQPLALVEALLRGYGLDAYAYDVTP